jgi:hypothetical protein
MTMTVEIKEGTRNGTTLASFVSYCVQHPDERFWQAVRNWSGYSFIMAYERVGGRGAGGTVDHEHDTFYLEGRHHDV